MFFKKDKSQAVEPIEITDQNFNELVMNAETPVMLDLWAPWCGPCKMIAPIIDEVAEEFEGRALVGKVNVDQNPKISEMFNVKSIPTIVFMQRDELGGKFAGLIPKPNMVEILGELIKERKAS